MRSFDVFNGDADGILSLVQLRLSDPRPEAELVTGRKRDIKLLSRVFPRAGDSVTVLDISLRSNLSELNRILETGATVFYADHHNADGQPEHENLFTCIDTSPEICTALIIDTCLKGQHRPWAVTAAFGDNFPRIAMKKAAGLNLPLERIQRLGMLINYNGYGAGLEDLHMDPAELYKALVAYETPMDFLEGDTEVYEKLDQGYEDDLHAAKSASIIDEDENGLIIELPDMPSSRRISGVYGNQLAQEHPDRAHAILTKTDESYLVSVRAPLNRRMGADTLCLQFETGGGRAAAAGINALPADDINRFIKSFRKAF